MDMVLESTEFRLPKLADIINKLSFHNLNFDKIFVKYGCKERCKLCWSVKIEKRTEILYC